MRIRDLTLALVVVVQASAALAQDDWISRSELQKHAALMARTSEGPVPFTTDGCSGGLSWTWRRAVATFPELAPEEGQSPAWEQCCVAHDRSYHNAGGAETATTSYAARLSADQELEACVSALGAQADSRAGAVLFDQLGAAMYRAVRFGGGPCTGYGWRWGYGFADC